MSKFDWMTRVLLDMGYFADLNGLQETSSLIEAAMLSLREDATARDFEEALEFLPDTQPGIGDGHTLTAEENWNRRTNLLKFDA